MGRYDLNRPRCLVQNLFPATAAAAIATVAVTTAYQRLTPRSTFERTIDLCRLKPRAGDNALGLHTQDTHRLVRERRCALARMKVHATMLKVALLLASSTLVDRFDVVGRPSQGMVEVRTSVHYFLCELEITNINR